MAILTLINNAKKAITEALEIDPNENQKVHIVLVRKLLVKFYTSFLEDPNNSSFILSIKKSDDWFLYHSVINKICVKFFKTGRCGEIASLALTNLLATPGFNANIEVMVINSKCRISLGQLLQGVISNHCLLILNRNRTSDFSDPTTYAKGTIIFDPSKGLVQKISWKGEVSKKDLLGNVVGDEEDILLELEYAHHNELTEKQIDNMIKIIELFKNFYANLSNKKLASILMESYHLEYPEDKRQNFINAMDKEINFYRELKKKSFVKLSNEFISNHITPHLDVVTISHLASTNQRFFHLFKNSLLHIKEFNQVNRCRKI